MEGIPVGRNSRRDSPYGFGETLFPDTEARENAVEEIVGIGGADDFPQVVKRFAQGHGDVFLARALTREMQCRDQVLAGGFQARADSRGDFGSPVPSPRVGGVESIGDEFQKSRESGSRRRGDMDVGGRVGAAGIEVVLGPREQGGGSDSAGRGFSTLVDWDAFQDQVGAARGALPLFRRLSGNVVGLTFDAGGVDELDHPIADGHGGVQGIARGARDGTDNGMSCSRERVEKAAFAGIGGPNEKDDGNFPLQSAMAQGIFERMELVFRPRESSDQLFGGDERDVLFNEVQARFNIREQVKEVGAQFGDRAGNAAGALVDGGMQIGEVVRFDQPEDAFRLGEIKTSGEKGTEGELAWAGKPRARGNALAFDR